MKNKVLLVLSIIILLLQPGCGGGGGGRGGYDPPDPPLPQVPGSIEGLVTATDGTPLAGVQVTLNKGQTTQTGANGAFTFINVTPGSGYSISCYLGGYRPTYAND